MSVAFIQHTQAKRTGGGNGPATAPYHPLAEAGDLQIFMVSAFAGSGPVAGMPSGSGWSKLHERSSVYTEMTLYVRTLEEADLTTDVVSPTTGSDWNQGQLRTYRGPLGTYFALDGYGDGLVAAATDAKDLLIRCWVECQNNFSGGSPKSLTAPAELLNSNSPDTYHWYDGGLMGDDPVVNDAAPTSTAVHGGVESYSTQWANVQLIIGEPPPPPVPILDDFAGDAFDAAYSTIGAVSGVTFDHPGVQATFGVDAMVLRAGPSSSSWSFELEFEDLSGPSSMAGLVFLDDNGHGVGVCSYHGGPPGVLICGIISYGYSSQFLLADASSSPTTTRYRLIRVGSTYTAQHSEDGGATWSAVSDPFTSPYTPTRVGFGDWLSGHTFKVTELAETVHPSTLGLTLPPLEAALGSAAPGDFSRADLPALSVDLTGHSQHNFEIDFLPALTVDVEATLPQVITNQVALPALSVETTLEPNPSPRFDTLLPLLAPDVWWTMDAADAYQSEGAWYMADSSGHGMPAVLGTVGGYSFPDGLVTDSTRSAFEGNNHSTFASGGDADGLQPGPLTSEEFSFFALVELDQASGEPWYVLHTPLGRTGMWDLSLQSGYWMFRAITDSGGFRSYYVNDPGDWSGPTSVGLVVTRDEAGNRFFQGFINGVPGTYTPEPAPIDADITFPDREGVTYRLTVGAGGVWSGPIQHAAYFKRALIPSDFSALHDAAFAARPRTSEQRTALPALQAAAAIVQPIKAQPDVVMPALGFSAYRGYPGRTPMGGDSWHTAVPVTRGLLTQPSMRTAYPQNDDSGLVQPYYSAWWKWTADTASQVWFSSMRSIPEPGSVIDTIISVYTESGGELTTVVIADDVGAWRASQAVIDHPVIGETYYIRLGAFNDFGSGISYYVLDNDLCPAPTLADLIVTGGSRGPAGAGTTDGAVPGTAPGMLSNSVSAPTHIPAGEQAWWFWTAEYTGTVSFDTLLSQNWFTGGAGAEDPRVGMELWSEGQFLEYSDQHGTETSIPRGQITYNVHAGQQYAIGIYPTFGAPDINGFLRISPIAQTGIVTPAPTSVIVDITSLPEGPETHFYATSGDHPLELATNYVATQSVNRARGFFGNYTMHRAYAGLAPQVDHMGALTCLWSQARVGSGRSQFWGKDASGYWYGSDPPPPDAIGRGDCASNWYSNATQSDVNFSPTAGFSYSADEQDIGFFTYADASMSVQGSHYQVGIAQLVAAVRQLDGVGEAASLSGISLMPDEVVDAEYAWDWYANVTRDRAWDDQEIKQWGPSFGGAWYGSGLTDGEQSAWMTRNLFEGRSPLRDGGSPVWTPLPDDLLAQVHAFENNPDNAGGRGLTLAYLPREVNQFNPPYQVWQAFGYPVASISAYATGRLLVKVDMQPPAMIGTGNPLGVDGNSFPSVTAYDSNGPTDGTEWPPPFDPGPVGSQILFGPYPVKFAPMIDVLVFGPRHKDIPWPDVALTGQTELELVTDVPTPNADPLARPAGSVRFEMPSFTVLDGVPVSSRAADRIAFTSEVVPPSLVDQLSATPHLVSLGEDLRFPPILATSAVSTSSYRRHPGEALQRRTTAEVTSLPSSDGSVTLSSPLPGPERVSSYAYWRGVPAATTAVSFRPSSIGEESLVAAAGDWITGDEITVLLTVVLNDSRVLGPLSPLFVAAGPTGTPRAGLFFNADSELMLWDTTYDVEDVNKRIRGRLQLVDDIRRTSQPVLIGARINNVTRKVTLVAGDSRLRTVETSLASAIPADHKLLIGDASALTAPGAFDLLDMRWWTRALPDHELLTAAAAMADLWGVLA